MTDAAVDCMSCVAALETECLAVVGMRFHLCIAPLLLLVAPVALSAHMPLDSCLPRYLLRTDTRCLTDWMLIHKAWSIHGMFSTTFLQR